MNIRHTALTILLLCALVLAACAPTAMHREPEPSGTSSPGDGTRASSEPPLDPDWQRVDRTIDLGPAVVGAGAGKIVLDVELPPEHKLSDLANSAIRWQVVGDVVVLPGEAGDPVAIDALPQEIEVTFRAGTGELTGDLFLGYCKQGQEGICLLERVRLRVPVTVDQDGEPVLRVTHRVTLPEF